MSKIYVKIFQVGMIDSNCYVISNENNNCLIIDLGGDFLRISDYLEQNKLNAQALLLTHGHYDHVFGAIDAQKTIPVFISELEKEFLFDDSLNLSPRFGFSIKNKIKNFKTFSEGKFIFGDFEVQVILTPGHTMGSACFLVDNKLFSGDTLFNRSFGRFDLPTGNLNELKVSLLKLFKFSDDMIVYPGHGDSTTVGAEKKFNLIYNYVDN